MRPTRLFRLALFLATVIALAGQPLKVSENRRFLVKADGTPFFYLADTAWELFHQLSYNDAYLYLSNRTGKGFTAIQCALLGELNGLTDPNAIGERPFIDLDATRPNEKYFKHVDDIIRMGTDMGLYLAVLPTWGAWAVKEQHPLFPPIQLLNASNARGYGRFLGSRYKDNPRIIWVLGGDRNPQGYESVWSELAAGLREGDGGSHLITYHPRGGSSSSEFWQNAPWLDFNMIQSGHAARFLNTYAWVEHDYAQQPVKPTLDSETNYEDAGVGFNTSNGLFDDYDVRRSSYYSVFAGGCGITYGCGNIWQMASGRYPILQPSRTWKQSLDLPGAFQMGHLRRLLESRPFLTRIPDQSVLVSASEGLVPTHDLPSTHLQATRDGTPGQRDATYIMVYLPLARNVKVKTDVIPAKQLRVWWFNPRHGTAAPVGLRENTDEVQGEWGTLPWHNSPGPDWVLVIDDASRNYPAPGSRPL